MCELCNFLLQYSCHSELQGCGLELNSRLCPGVHVVPARNGLKALDHMMKSGFICRSSS